MSNYDITELGWENGQPSKHEHVGILPTSKTTWGTADDTLESIVHQATCLNINLPEFDHYLTQHHHLNNKNSVVTSTSKYGEYSKIELDPPLYTKKRVQSSEHSDQCGVNDLSSSQQEQADKRSCTGMNNLSSSHQEQANKRLGVSANAANCRDNDTIMMTLASLESPTSLKTKPGDEDSGCHAGSDNQDDEPENKGEMVRSRSSKRSRVAALHNQSERKRRDRINQKMKTLQKLVPNANKTDKASMLDEVIEHLKQLQAQVEMMSTRNIPQMMMPPGMQQQLQMSHLARMGMSVGLGMNMGPMLDMRTASQPLSSLVNPNYAKTAATPTYIPPQFMVPPMIPRQMYPQASTLHGATNLNSVPFSDPCSVFPPQSMNMELYNKMVEAVYQQQVNQAAQTTNGSNSKSKHVQGE